MKFSCMSSFVGGQVCLVPENQGKSALGSAAASSRPSSLHNSPTLPHSWQFLGRSTGFLVLSVPFCLTGASESGRLCLGPSRFELLA